MITAIFTFLASVAGIGLFFLKNKNEEKTPDEKFEADKQEFNKSLVARDGRSLSAYFKRLHDRARRKFGNRGDTGGQGNKNPHERKL